MASYNQKINISGEFRIVGKAFKAENKVTSNGETKVYSDRFEVYALYCDNRKDGLYTDKPLIGTAKVSLKDFVSLKGERNLKGKASVYGDVVTILELEGMQVDNTAEDKREDRLKQLIEEAGLNEVETAGKTAKENK